MTTPAEGTPTDDRTSAMDEPQAAVPPTGHHPAATADYAPTQPSAASAFRNPDDLLADLQDLGDELPSFTAKNRKRRPKAADAEVVRPKARLPLGNLSPGSSKTPPPQCPSNALRTKSTTSSP